MSHLRMCDLCEKPLNGWCVEIPFLGVFCEKCITDTMYFKLGEKYLKEEEQE